MSTTFCLSVRTECASDDNTTRTDFSHYFRSLAEVVLNTLYLTYKQASKSITTHGWWAEVGLSGLWPAFVLLKSGGRFSKNAAIAFLVSADRTRTANSWSSVRFRQACMTPPA